MAPDEALAARLRQLLAGRGGIAERRMMGTRAFLLDGRLCCGVAGTALMVRTGRDAGRRLLGEPHVRPMAIAGRPATGFVLVDAEGLRTDAALAEWVDRALAFTATLPPKGA